MDIRKLEILAANASEDAVKLHAQATNLRIFMRSGTAWRAYAKAGVRRNESAHFDRVLALGSFFQPSRSNTVYLWIDDFKVVICVDCAKKLAKPAVESMLDALGRVVDASLNEYDATHDSLTGLKNRSVFDVDLKSALQRVAANAKKIESAMVAEDGALTSAAGEVVLASIDVDHFKSINDRFGHGYGDIVLAALARRLENAAGRLANDPAISVCVYRLGGEEFQILFCGTMSGFSVPECLEGICAAIRDEELPNDGEYASLSMLDFADGTALPSKSERRVTISVGVSSVERKIVRAGDEAKLIKRRSDLALSAAKQWGRDRIIDFAQILPSFGRISFVDATNGVVAIDIGEEVGVKNGQEFFVYPPSYDGQTPFYIGEGRSRKAVGVYPKFRSARISAFDVQNEVSFCKVTLREGGVQGVVEGASLEAIPLGSISHLVTDLSGDDRFADQSVFLSRIRELAKGADVAVLAVSIIDLETISEQRGIDRANEWLARAGTAMIAQLGAVATICQVNVNSLVASIVVDDSKGAKMAASALYSDVAKNLDKAKVGIGWVHFRKDGVVDDLPELKDVGGLVDAAILASSTPPASGRHCIPFSNRLFTRALYLSRSQGQYTKLFADYKRFSELGAGSRTADSQVAFSYLRGPFKNLELAGRYFTLAGGHPDSSDIQKANLGAFHVITGSYSEAFSILEPLSLDDGYLGALFFAALRSRSTSRFVSFVHSRTDDASRLVNEGEAWLSRDERREVVKRVRDLIGAAVEVTPPTDR